MDDPWCRVSVQCAAESRAVDVALPRHARLGLVVPSIVDLVIETDPSDGDVRGWRLDRACGGRLDESMTLQESGVHDGDVLVLGAVDAPAPTPPRDDAFRTVADADGPAECCGLLPTAVWVWPGVVSAAGLGYSGVVGGGAAPAAALAGVTAVALIAIAYQLADASVRLVICAVGVVFGAVAGCLTVPGPPGIPHVVLAAGVGCAVSLLVARFVEGDPTCFIGSASTCALLAAATATAVVLSADLAVVGAVLVVLSLAVLGVAARFAMLSAGLTPGRPSLNVADSVAAQGRSVLCGLVTGCSVAAAVGAGLIAVGCLRGAAPWPAGVALCGVVGGLLLLRVRLYADPRCRAAAGWCGLLGATVSFALLCVSVPQHAGWLGVATVAVTGWCYGKRSTASPTLARGVDIMEYVLLAAVVPVACWVSGGYELIRSLSIA